MQRINHYKNVNGARIYAYAQLLEADKHGCSVGLDDNISYFKKAKLTFSDERDKLKVEIEDNKNGCTIVEYANGKLIGALRLKKIKTGNIITNPKDIAEFCTSMLREISYGMAQGMCGMTPTFTMEDALDKLDHLANHNSIDVLVEQLKPHFGEKYSGSISDYFQATLQNHNV